ncbi:MAG TPA: tRNA pseudouridine(13) synthase TruD [Gemmataceae bacterium]|nr:tRNA pseudouridine(13) synthase TruD [Gemmataceae bacterium]
MKLKQRPDDFIVEEATAVAPTDEGPFALYRLEKRGWSTPDALAAVRRRWRIEPRRISYGGLKDRHAWTIQYLTIFHGPRRDLRHHDVTVTHLGWTHAPYTSQDIRCNRFQLTLRDLSAEDVERGRPVLERIAVDGVPNYFDDQRFGSVAAWSGDQAATGQEFIARLLVQGRFEDALRLALTAPYEFDRGPQKKEKTLLRQRWGDWPALKDLLPRGHARSLVDYLRVHPGDFRGAVVRLRPELRGLYLSAYQSHLWNRMLARWLTQRLRPEQLQPVALRLGAVPFPIGLDAEQRAELSALQLPLPSSRLKLEPSDPQADVVQAVLAEEGLNLQDMQIRGVREMFFSKGERAALCIPANLREESAADELHPKRRKWTLAFELPRGCYATLLVKAATQLASA